MINYSFSMHDLEFFLLIFTRVSCFVFTAPFFSMKNTPANVRIGISLFTSVLLYQALTPAEAVVYDSVLEYFIIVMKEAVVGLLVGLAASICTSIVNFAGSIADMETGLSMVTLMDPTSRENTSITGVMYQYSLMLMMIVTGMYRYLFGALADTFSLIPVNRAVFRSDALLSSLLEFLGDYVVIGFRIVLPVFCTILLLNAVLGVLAKVSPQMNMFAVGIQMKILVGLSVLFFTAGMLPGAADFIFQEMKRMIVSFVGDMI
ncbi:MAG: flagellar biosynthetic protein FliR [Acetatifactor sp.]|nr:flagellar biosynthetic protein FliR [Acetatifactor sp.]MDE7353762.1 flagellar biosynthetic protein FliR [Acetatifactor sp.]